MKHAPRKKHRLDPEVYKEPLVALITVLTHERRRVFEDGQLVKKCRNILFELSQKYNWIIHIVSFLPDHVHLLVETREENDLLAFLRNYKQKTGFAVKQRTGENLWHRSYLDQLIDRTIDMERAYEYVLDNPANHGLVKDVLDYPYTFSFEHEDILEPRFE